MFKYWENPYWPDEAPAACAGRVYRRFWIWPFRHMRAVCNSCNGMLVHDIEYKSCVLCGLECHAACFAFKQFHNWVCRSCAHTD